MVFEVDREIAVISIFFKYEEMKLRDIELRVLSLIISIRSNKGRL